MGNCGVLLSTEGKSIATYKTPKSRVSLDNKGMLKDLKDKVGLHEYGKIEDQNTKAVTPSRRFLLK